MCVKGTYGKQHMERTELSVMSYVQRMSYDGSMATSDSGFSCSSPGDKVTWRFSSQPLYLQVSSRIDFAKTSTVQTELGFELSTLCVQAFYCWLWRVPGLLPLSESGWVHSPPAPSHLGVELWMCHYSGTWPSQLELLYHYMWEASLCRS